MDYFNQMKNRRRSSQILQAPKPVLTEEEEAFLRQVTDQSNSQSPVAGEASAEAPIDTTKAPVDTTETSTSSNLNGEAHEIPLPASPGEEFGKTLGEQGRRESQISGLTTPAKGLEPVKSQSTAAPDKKKKRWSTMFWKKGADSKKVSLFTSCILLHSTSKKY